MTLHIVLLTLKTNNKMAKVEKRAVKSITEWMEIIDYNRPLRVRDINIVHINRASLTITIGGEDYLVFISRRNYNLLLSGAELNYRLIEQWHEDKRYIWVAVLTLNIF